MNTNMEDFRQSLDKASI